MGVDDARFNSLGDDDDRCESSLATTVPSTPFARSRDSGSSFSDQISLSPGDGAMRESSLL